MRVTDKMGFNQVMTNLQKNRAEMSELQNQAATQKRVNKPSDDPIAMTRALSSKTDEKGGQQYLKNINMARSFLDSTDVSLAELSEVLMRLKELAIQQANDAGASADTRKIVAEEVAQVFNQTINIGNRKFGERFIFGGNRTTQSPFETSGNYNGDDGDMRIHISKDSFLSMNVPGSTVFLGEGLGSDGTLKAQIPQPKSVDDLVDYKNEERLKRQQELELEQEDIKVRGPASNGRGEQFFKSDIHGESSGINILQSIRDFQIALKVNDREQVQDAIDNLDHAITQVVHARAQVGARIQVLNATTDSLQKNILDNKSMTSQMEDADLLQVVSDMSKADSTLKATLETSGRLIQPSLLDFLK